MRVVALKAWSNGSISMEERQIAELPDALATSLIEQVIVAPTALPEITDADDGKVLTANSGVWVAANPSSGGGAVVHAAVSESTVTLDKTWQEIFDGDYSSVSVLTAESNKILGRIVQVSNELTSYYVNAKMGVEEDLVSFSTDSESGYPALDK